MARNDAVLLCVALVCLCGFVFGAPQGDLVTGLPDLKGSLGTLYSGYIRVDGLNFHYVFSPSKGQQSDPLILWMNGGPGCSSMEGWLYELGSLQFDAQNNTLNPGRFLVNNPWTWNNLAHLLFLESPVGVGFSYADNGNTNTNDNITADNNLKFVNGWFQEFPEYQSNDFYVTGESYAGTYVPMLAWRVATQTSFNLKGFVTFDPITDYASEQLNIYWFPFLVGHNIISMDFFKNATAVCQNQWHGNLTVECNLAYDASMAFFNGYDGYDIYRDCRLAPPKAASLRMVIRNDTQVRNMLRSLQPLKLDVNVTKQESETEAEDASSSSYSHHPWPTPMGPCEEPLYRANRYMNRYDVQAALHVNNTIQWMDCANINYTRTRFSVLPEYSYLRSRGYRIMTVNGDADPSVPLPATEWWALPFGRQGNQRLTVEWANWYITNDDGPQIGGHVSAYTNFTFVTVVGSGHMVPQFKPIRALTLMTNYLNNLW